MSTNLGLYWTTS